MFKISNAIILAAGRGTRMKDLCDNTPKPLLKLNEKPLIEAIIEKLKKSGIKKITIVTGYMSEKFDYLIEKYNLSIVKNGEWESTNNMSSLKRVKHLLSNTLIINGDVVLKIPKFKKWYKTSCTYAELNTNINEWAITVDKKGNILDFNKNPGDWDGLFQREVTIFSKKLSKVIRNNIDKCDLNEYYEIIALEQAKNHKINFKPFIIEKNLIFDIDNKEEFLKMQDNYFNEDDDKYRDYVDHCSCEDK